MGSKEGGKRPLDIFPDHVLEEGKEGEKKTALGGGGRSGRKGSVHIVFTCLLLKRGGKKGRRGGGFPSFPFQVGGGGRD